MLNIVYFGEENLHPHFELQRDWNLINSIILRSCQIFMNSIAWREGAITYKRTSSSTPIFFFELATEVT
jgi:hypothetical protein